MSLSESLREMGFEDKMIQKAIKKSKADTLEQAIEWIIQNQDRDLSSDDEPALVLKPLPEDKPTKTAEEIEQEKKRVEELIKKRKQEREEVERREAIEREKDRRKTGNEIVQLREKVQNEERIRAAQEMRREKIERELHHKKVLEEIRRDRERMKAANAAQNNAAGSSASSNADAAVKQPEASGSNAVSTSNSTPKTYDTTRLAIRLPDGTNLVQTFNSNEQLCAVRLFVQLNRKDIPTEDARVSRFNFILPPSQVFTEDHMEQSLTELGLCPSARLNVKNLN